MGFQSKRAEPSPDENCFETAWLVAYGGPDDEEWDFKEAARSREGGYLRTLQAVSERNYWLQMENFVNPGHYLPMETVVGREVRRVQSVGTVTSVSPTVIYMMDDSLVTREVPAFELIGERIQRDGPGAGVRSVRIRHACIPGHQFAISAFGPIADARFARESQLWFDRAEFWPKYS